MELNSNEKNCNEGIQFKELTFLKGRFNLYKNMYIQLKANYKTQELQWE